MKVSEENAASDFRAKATGHVFPLTSETQAFTQKEVWRGAVPIVPHEGVCKSMASRWQVVQPAKFHAVLVTVTVVIGLAVVVAVLCPTGEPVCKRQVACHPLGFNAMV
jgi:hypothetical protein